MALVAGSGSVHVCHDYLLGSPQANRSLPPRRLRRKWPSLLIFRRLREQWQSVHSWDTSTHFVFHHHVWHFLATLVIRTMLLVYFFYCSNIFRCDSVCLSVSLPSTFCAVIKYCIWSVIIFINNCKILCTLYRVIISTFLNIYVKRMNNCIYWHMVVRLLVRCWSWMVNWAWF